MALGNVRVSWPRDVCYRPISVRAGRSAWPRDGQIARARRAPKRAARWRRGVCMAASPITSRVRLNGRELISAAQRNLSGEKPKIAPGKLALENGDNRRHRPSCTHLFPLWQATEARPINFAAGSSDGEKS